MSDDDIDYIERCADRDDIIGLACRAMLADDPEEVLTDAD